MIPVVVIGAARSGTKFLRGLLGTPDVMSVVPHDVGFVWRHGLEHVGHDELRPEQLAPGRATWIRDQLHRLARGSSTRSATHMVEKSVPNSLRPAYVAAVLPDAQFVHLVRDGRQVVESARRSWTAPTDYRTAVRKLITVPPSLLPVVVAETVGVGPRWARRSAQTWGPRYDGIDADLQNQQLVEVCARQWARCVTASLDQLGGVSQPVHTVDFQRLVTDERVVIDLARNLGLGSDAQEDIVRRWSDDAEPGNLDTWRLGLTPDARAIIAPTVNPVNARLGHALL